MPGVIRKRLSQPYRPKVSFNIIKPKIAPIGGTADNTAEIEAEPIF